MHAHNYKINSTSCNLVFSPLHNAYGSTLVSFCIVWALPISLWICSFVQLYCVCFFCLHTWWKGSSHSLCLAVCHVCMYHWTLFSLPENAWFGWQGFLICPTLLCLFLLSLHMVKGIMSQPPCSSLPTIYHWTLFFLPKNASSATIWLVQLFRVCLFVSAHCGRDEVTSLSVVCCQACTTSLTKCCFLFAICVSSLTQTLTRAVTKSVPFVGSSFVWELILVRTRNLHTHNW